MTGYKSYKNPGHHSIKNSQVVALMVPFPMQGHLNQMLHLAHLLTFYGLQVHYAGDATHNRQAKLRVHGWDSECLSKIHFHDFQLPPFDALPPDPKNPIKFPGHLQPLFDATLHLRQPMSRLLHKLSTEFRRIIIIHDTLMASVVQDVRLIPNAETYALHSVSAFTLFFYTWDSISEKPYQLDSDIPQCIPPNEGCFTPEFASFIAKQYKVLDFENGRLYNTCRVIEGRYLDLLAKLPRNANKKLFAIGPLNPVHMKRRCKERRNTCLEWLDEQEPDSVIYVSFGTAITMTDAQIKEVAVGLENSRQKFIWVLRNADKVDVFTEDESTRPQLPQGFEERVKNRGIIVRSWAPQLEILAHSSTGGFMSHCGWNSCMESISMGVPIAAWPMHSDQPRNSILITEVLRIGTLVRDWKDQTEVVKSTTVENAVRRLMKSIEGEEMRKRALKLGTMIRGSAVKDTASQFEMDSFISHITR